ncbi:ectoine hydroxylase-related dioxygenase (phytanoyl-CoA dioxygenase family) [Lipingzhangella halophila]|uniref:Ectoine hydroxylase-related dioxygenase (Phytanoyl-CoA dioxygenase family) n=1 Tax=Lipingzhangella halophila TaxID=1783352 RepID=A0A7W7W2V8_9ACTN|nr:phytanoyl-CoA dioxygenase family protein [Lipingzhangella halophila]MBB4932382.1 ectoine hydroxylase-related dioxygenase (phytanoyl-CoA dioxygenase family) [Lipingzhangella halophila]
MQPTISAELHSPYELPAATIADFERDGFVKLSGVLDRGTLEQVEPDITDKVRALNTTDDVPYGERSVLQKAFLQVGNLWRNSQGARDLVFSHRLAHIATQLLGVEGVRLFADQALYKQPSGDITPWHADQYYWPIDSDRVCTVWIPLQDTPLEMGPLAFARASHRFEYGRDLPISEDSERQLQEALARERFETVQQPFELGDVSFHLGWTFHRAGQNEASSPRRVMTVIFLDAATRVSRKVGEHQQPQLDILMPGTEPGGLPNGPANPLLYPL